MGWLQGRRQATNPMDFTFWGWEASQGGTKQQDHDEEQQEGSKRPMPHFGPQALGRLWAQEAPQVGPTQALPLGSQTGSKAHWYFVDLWV